MAQSPTDSRLTGRELFGVAAEHFTGRDFDPDALDAIWRELESEARTSAELASDLEHDIGDLEAFLDWTSDQGLIEATRSAGNTYYSRYDYQYRDLSNRLRSIESKVEGISFRYFGPSLIVAGIGVPIVASILAVWSMDPDPTRTTGDAVEHVFLVAMMSAGLALSFVTVCFGISMYFQPIKRWLDALDNRERRR